MRLCRIVREPAVWACLAALALQGADLECAELCLAAIDEVDKLHFVQVRPARVQMREGRIIASQK